MKALPHTNRTSDNMVENRSQQSSSSAQLQDFDVSNEQCSKSASAGHPTISDYSLQNKLAQGSEKSSLKITLKVKVPTDSLDSGIFRFSHRKRQPTQKKLQLADAVNENAWASLQDSSRTRKSKKTPRRRHKAVSSSGRRSASTVRRRKRKRDDDTDYWSPTSARRQTIKHAPMHGELLQDMTFEMFDEEAMVGYDTKHQELTMDDFKAPTPFGFPLRVKPGNGGTALIQSQSQNGDQLRTLSPKHSHSVGSIKAIRESDLPNTPEFWMDWFIAEQAYRSSDIDFKMLCLNMMKFQDKACIPKITVNNPLIPAGSVCFFGQLLHQHENGYAVIEESQRLRDVMPAYGKDCRKDPDDFRILLTYNDWDILLASIKLARKEMYSHRRHKIKAKRAEAERVVQEMSVRNSLRGDLLKNAKSIGIVDEANSITEAEYELHDKAAQTCASFASSIDGLTTQ